jgi:predicted nucleotidyltransferase
MLTAMHPAIASKREAPVALCWRHGIARMDVFGSAARGHDFDPARSDVDLLVTFEAGRRPRALADYDGVSQAFAAAIDRPVDLIDRTVVEASRTDTCAAMRPSPTRGASMAEVPLRDAGYMLDMVLAARDAVNRSCNWQIFANHVYT